MNVLFVDQDNQDNQDNGTLFTVNLETIPRIGETVEYVFYPDAHERLAFTKEALASGDALRHVKWEVVRVHTEFRVSRIRDASHLVWIYVKRIAGLPGSPGIKGFKGLPG